MNKYIVIVNGFGVSEYTGILPTHLITEGTRLNCHFRKKIL